MLCIYGIVDGLLGGNICVMSVDCDGGVWVGM